MSDKSIETKNAQATAEMLDQVPKHDYICKKCSTEFKDYRPPFCYECKRRWMVQYFGQNIIKSV